MSFYIILPSNSSFKEFPNNTQTNYSTQLEIPIDLNGPYEVALSEICYSSDIDADLGTLKLKNLFSTLYNMRQDYIEVPIIIKNGLSIDDFVTYVNNKIKEVTIITEYKRRYWLAHIRDEELMRQVEHKSKRDDKPIINIMINISSLTIYDVEDSIYKEKYLKIGAKYMNLIHKWNIDDFDKSTFDKIQHEFKIKLYFSPPDTIKFMNHDIDAFLETLPDFNKYNDISNPIDEFFKFEKVEITNRTEYYQDRCLKQIIYDYNHHFENIIPIFSSTKHNFLKIINKSNEEITFNGMLSDILFRESNSTTKRFLEKIFNFVKFLNIINYAFVYTDIITDQFIGDRLVPALRSIVIKSNFNGEVSTFYENPHYVPVNKSRLETINIQLKDLHGNTIKFKDSFAYIIVKLHFRKRQE